MNKIIPANKYCKKVFDGTHETPKPVENGKPLVTSKNILGKNLDLSTAYNISYEDYLSIQKRSAVSQWDVLFSMIGSVGEVYLQKDPNIPYAIKNIGVFSCKNEEKAKWLYYYFQSPSAQTHIKRYLNGAVQKFLPLNALRNFPVLEYDTQNDFIVNLLFSIDSKIELNNKINQELEAMAKTLYDYWFVQFDFPNEQGNPYKSSGGKMVYNEELKREIPEGWEVKTLDNVESNIITGKTPTTTEPKNFNGSIPFICIGDVRGNMHITKTEITLSEIGASTQANKFIPKGSICVTCIASPGLVAFVTENSQTNQQLNSIVCKQFENQYYLYFYLKNYFKYAKAKTGNTFANMNKGDFSSIKVIKSKKAILANFAITIKPLVENVLLNSNQNQQLTELRDWLLPMLMNGQVRVN